LINPWEPNFSAYDIVHFFSCYGGSEPFCAFIKSLKLPLVVSSSLWITNKTKHQYNVKEICNQLSHADKIVTNSQLESSILAEVLSVNRDKFTHVYNGANEIFFAGEKTSLFTDQYNIDTNYILNVGNIEPRKNQKLLIDAMKQLPQHKLVLAGRVRDHAYFDQCDIEGNKQVLFVGNLPASSPILVSAYKNADVFCLPSSLETPGIAAIEAFACETPLVVTAIGSTREYFGDAAIYINEFSPRTIVDGLKQALVVKRATDRTSVNVMSWGSAVARLDKLYTSMLN
jgi:glycosyltransferase involved in cell wall biosynthesis